MSVLSFREPGECRWDLAALGEVMLRLDPGEEVMGMLLGFVEREEIQGGFFLGLGAFSRVRLRYFDVHRKQYQDNDVSQQVE